MSRKKVQLRIVRSFRQCYFLSMLSRSRPPSISEEGKKLLSMMFVHSFVHLFPQKALPSLGARMPHSGREKKTLPETPGNFQLPPTNFYRMTTVLVLRMAHRKWIETEQQTGTAEPGNMLGCCLNYFHFLWAILSTGTVHRSVQYLASLAKGQVPST